MLVHIESSDFGLWSGNVEKQAQQNKHIVNEIIMQIAVCINIWLIEATVEITWAKNVLGF